MNIQASLVIGAFCALVSITQANPVFGPFNAIANGSGSGHVEWFDGPPPTEADAAWTISAWVKPAAAVAAQTIVAGFGDGTDYVGGQRYLCADSQGWFFWYGGSVVKKKELVKSPDRLATSAGMKPGAWQHVSATFNGKTLLLYVDGREVAKGDVKFTRASMQPMVAPPPAWDEGACFNGKVAHFSIFGSALSGQEIAQLAKPVKDLDAWVFTPAPAGPTPVNRSDIMQFANGERNPGIQRPDFFPKPVPPVALKRTPKLTDLSVAEVTLKADVRNVTAQTQNFTIEAELAGGRVSQKLSLAPNETRTVALAPTEFPQLVIKNPGLWWPNGYGEPVLHDLTFRIVDSAGVESSQLSKRVGLRQMDYDYLPKKDKPDVKDGPFYIKVNGRRIFVHGGSRG